MKRSAILTQREKALVAERNQLLDVADANDFTEEKEKRCKDINAALPELRKQIKDAEEAEKRDAEVRAVSEQPWANSTSTTIAQTRESDPYYQTGSGISFFKDLAAARHGDSRSILRLNTLNETRGVDTSGTSAGTFAPPAWLIDQWIQLARPARVAANLLNRQALPSGVSSINVPKVTTGTITGVQPGQNNDLPNQDLKAGSVSSGITTVGGQSVISLQLLEQSPIDFDTVIATDLAAAYAAQLDSQVLNGTGGGTGTEYLLRGLLSAAANLPTVPLTSTALTFTQVYASIVSAINQINTTRFAPPTAILMHPRRWAWLLEQVDSTGRPLVLGKDNGAMNASALSAGSIAQGQVGSMLGLPVYVDPNMPTNLGAGTDEDSIIVAKFDDIYLYETTPTFQAFDAPYANQASMLYRTLGYAALIPDRYRESVAIISGTGLAAPTL